MPPPPVAPAPVSPRPMTPAARPGLFGAFYACGVVCAVHTESIVIRSTDPASQVTEVSRETCDGPPFIISLDGLFLTRSLPLSGIRNPVDIPLYSNTKPTCCCCFTILHRHACYTKRCFTTVKIRRVGQSDHERSQGCYRTVPSKLNSIEYIIVEPHCGSEVLQTTSIIHMDTNDGDVAEVCTCGVRECQATNLDVRNRTPHKQRRKQILRHLRIMKRQVPVPYARGSATTHQRRTSCDVPIARLFRLMQYTAIGSPSDSPSRWMVNRTKTRSRMSPAHSKGSLSVSCHTGLNPLFFTALVRIVVTARCACAWLVDEVAGGTLEGEGEREGERREEGRVGRLQSGVWMDTSTYGSTCLSVISCPMASFGRGSC